MGETLGTKGGTLGTSGHPWDQGDPRTRGSPWDRGGGTRDLWDPWDWACGPKGPFSGGFAPRPPFGRPSASIWTHLGSIGTTKLIGATWAHYGILISGPYIVSTRNPTWGPLGNLHGVHLGPYVGSTWDPT